MLGKIVRNIKTLKTYKVIAIEKPQPMAEVKVKLEGIGTRNITTTIKALNSNYTIVEEEEKEKVKEEVLNPIKEDLKLKDKVIIVTRDLKLHKGTITFIGEFTYKIKNIKEENLFKKDIFQVYNEDTDYSLLKEYIETLKPQEEEKEAQKEAPKTTKEEEGIVTLRDIVEEIVREGKLILDLQFNPNNTFKDIRRKIRKKSTTIKALKLEGYSYTFLIENKEAIKDELIKILG